MVHPLAPDLAAICPKPAQWKYSLFFLKNSFLLATSSILKQLRLLWFDNPQYTQLMALLGGFWALARCIVSRLPLQSWLPSLLFLHRDWSYEVPISSYFRGFMSAYCLKLSTNSSSFHSSHLSSFAPVHSLWDSIYPSRCRRSSVQSPVSSLWPMFLWSWIACKSCEFLWSYCCWKLQAGSPFL